MPQHCMAGLPPTKELIGLKVPYGAWEADTLITDTFGNPMFSVLDVQHQAMGAYEAIFGDENGHKLCYVKRRLITAYWKDGWDFCTYKPNFPGQPKYKERDMYGKAVYPFSFLHVRPLKCRYQYSVHKEDLENMEPVLSAMHGWLGSMTVCCTPLVRFGKWQVEFHRPDVSEPEINIDQAKNLVEVERGNDLLAALCMAYAFDKALCQPLVTIIGYEEKEHMDDDDDSLDSFDPENLGAAANGNRGADPDQAYAVPYSDDATYYSEDPTASVYDEPTRQIGYGDQADDATHYSYDPNYDEGGNYIGDDGQYDDNGNYVAPVGYIENNYDDDGNYVGPQSIAGSAQSASGSVRNVYAGDERGYEPEFGVAGDTSQQQEAESVQYLGPSGETEDGYYDERGRFMSYEGTGNARNRHQKPEYLPTTVGEDDSTYAASFAGDTLNNNDHARVPEGNLLSGATIYEDDTVDESLVGDQTDFTEDPDDYDDPHNQNQLAVPQEDFEDEPRRRR